MDRDVVHEAFERLVDAEADLRAAEIRQAIALADLAESYWVDVDTLIPELAEKTIHPGEEGTPGVSEFLTLELGPALGMTRRSAFELVAGVLNLKHRHPETWDAFCTGEVRRWQAIKLTELTAGLSADAAGWVDDQIGRHVGRIAFSRLAALTRGWVAQADAELARKREDEGRRMRRVSVGRPQDGTTEIYACLAARDALALDTTMRELACAMGEAGDERSLDQRRASALGLLADPARALAWLTDGPPPVDGSPVAGAGRRRNPRGRTVVYVHLSEETLVEPATGVARIDGLGPLTTATLPEFLSGTNVTVRPVVDDATIAPVDAYEVPGYLRDVVMRQQVAEAWPFGSSSSQRLDLDHIVPYARDAARGSGQTAVTNLAPLSRTVHRAKTLGAWKVRRRPSGDLEWVSPLGNRYIVGPYGTRPPYSYERRLE